MNTPVTSTEEEIARCISKAGINADIGQRWETGQEHHPRAEKLAREIAAVDWLYGEDSFHFRFGDEGDNGEFLVYLLDILFELREALGAPIVSFLGKIDD